MGEVGDSDSLAKGKQYKCLFLLLSVGFAQHGYHQYGKDLPFFMHELKPETVDASDALFNSLRL